MLLNTKHPTVTGPCPTIRNYADSNVNSAKVQKVWFRLSYIELTNLQISVTYKKTKMHIDVHSMQPAYLIQVPFMLRSRLKKQLQSETC